MLARRSLLIVWLAASSALAAFSLAGSASAEHKVRLAVVVAKNNPLGELTLRELKRLYTGEQVTGADGKKLLPLAQAPSSADRAGFDRLVTGMSQDALARHWVDRRIRGQSGAPKAVSPPELLLRVVPALRNSIGYVKASEVSGEVKVLRVDGKAPGDAGYPLEY